MEKKDIGVIEISEEDWKEILTSSVNLLETLKDMVVRKTIGYLEEMELVQYLLLVKTIHIELLKETGKRLYELAEYSWQKKLEKLLLIKKKEEQKCS